MHNTQHTAMAKAACTILHFVFTVGLLATAHSFSTSQLQFKKPPRREVAAMASSNGGEAPHHVSNVLFIECGFGNDSHGQSATKAAVRACRNSIEFNSIPSIARLVPGGYDGLKLSVLLAVPPKYQSNLDLEEVKAVFPYGDVKFEIQDGGMIAPSGIAIDALGDKNQDMVVVCAAVTVGY